MKRTFNFGKIDYNGTGRKINLVTLDVELEEKDGKSIFSASGKIWNSKKSDILRGGQCLDTIAEYVKALLFKQIYRFWKLYHSNDMHAGTVEQESAIEEWKKEGNRYNYTDAINHLKSIGLYEVEIDGSPY